jgi:rare lipoprotein A
MKLFGRGLVLLVLALPLFLAPACARKREPQIALGQGRTQEGVASWYGKEFQGRPTASGERFDMHDLTAAHRTLPFGARVQVTNLENGKSVVVRINDRGPNTKGRLIDLSYAAAKQLDMIGAGTAKVRIQVLP